MRVTLFLVVGTGGFVIGGLVGAVVSVVIDAATGSAGQPGDVLVAYAWAISMLGAVLGAVGSVIWLGAELGRG